MVMTEHSYAFHILPPITGRSLQVERFVQRNSQLDTCQDTDFMPVFPQCFGLIQTEQTSVRGEERGYLKYVHCAKDNVLLFAKVRKIALSPKVLRFIVGRMLFFLPVLCLFDFISLSLP